MMNKRRAAILITVGLLIVGVAAALYARVNAYTSLLRYDVSRSYQYTFDSRSALNLPVTISGEGFSWPAVSGTWDTAFLRLKIQPALGGRLEDPYVEAGHGSIVARQYLERGAAGFRYINLSTLAAHPPSTGENIRLGKGGLSWQTGAGMLILFNNRLSPKSSVLVIAPHPDDAEIAAFGLYSHADSFILTITAGDAGTPRYDRFYSDSASQSLAKGKLRAWDSITVPMLGGVPPSRTVNLGYFDGTLAAMFSDPQKECSPLQSSVADMTALRHCGLAALPLKHTQKPAWCNLVADLVCVLRGLRPAIIVTPHPLLDSHPDHQYATVAVCEALMQAREIKPELYLYANHHVRAEIFPFGPPDSLASLPPWFDESVVFKGVYSHPVAPDGQTEKLFALEAMHDLRPPPQLDRHAGQFSVRGFLAAVGDRVTGSSWQRDFYFYRRAVRPNEIFFVFPAEDTDRLARQFTERTKR